MVENGGEWVGMVGNGEEWWVMVGYYRISSKCSEEEKCNKRYVNLA